MEDLTNDGIEADERGLALLVGILIGFVVGLSVALAARTETGAGAREKLATTVGDIDVSGGVQRSRDVVAAGQKRAVNIVNQSPLPVTIGLDTSADSGAATPLDPDAPEAGDAVTSPASSSEPEARRDPE